MSRGRHTDPSRSAARVAGTVGLALWLPRPALAFELYGSGPLANASVQVGLDGELRYNQYGTTIEGFEDEFPNLDDNIEQVNRLNLLVTKGSFTLGAQVDEVSLLLNRYELDGELQQSFDLYDDTELRSPFENALVVLEKVYVQKRWDRLELTAGDAYASFGRGMALNIVKNTDLDVDTSIRGAKFAWRLGDVDVSLVSGLTNAQQVSQDNPNVDLGQDPATMVTGLRAVHYSIGRAQVGLHGVVYAFGRAADIGSNPLGRYDQGIDASVTGASLEVPGLAGIDWYAEANLYGYLAPELAGGDEPLNGHALYASGSAYPGKAIILVEAKTTQDTERLNSLAVPYRYEVANVPTLEYERVITEDSSAAVNSNDIAGARVRVDYAVRPAELVPYLSLAGFQDDDLAGLHFNRSPEIIGHAVAGLQWIAGSRVVQVNAGGRVDVREDSDAGADRLAHLDGELHQPLPNGDALEIAVAGQQFWWGVNPSQQADFVQVQNTLAWHRGEQLVFLAFADWTDNPLVSSEGNVTQKLYAAGEVRWNAGPNGSIRAFYGAYKAGIRCAGGQCRNLPGFEGARISYNTTF